MALLKPRPGLVIRYHYLWNREHDAGNDEATKSRPACIVLALEPFDGEQLVSVVPITRQPPASSNASVEIPQRVKEHLNLDHERSWAIVSEINTFRWPGPDLEPVQDGNPTVWEYGVLPPKLFDQIRNNLINQLSEQRLAIIRRTD